MCMISAQGMNCSKDNCCHRNLNFCICQVWICNSAIIRLQGKGRSHPSDHPFVGFPSYLPPCQLHALTHWNNGKTIHRLEVILETLPGWFFRGCFGAFCSSHAGRIRSGLCSLTQVFSNTCHFFFFYNSMCFPLATCSYRNTKHYILYCKKPGCLLCDNIYLDSL